jgi:CheY-like chemotaxis protein
VTVDQERDGCRFEVRDDGIGIAPEALPRLFQPFVQVRSPGEASQGGLGLGLSLVKGLVELHGGSITASSPGLGQGTTFEFWLPLQARRPRAMEKWEASKRRAPGLRILVVDDNVDAADMLAELVASDGHAVEVAHDGATALSAAARMHPHLVFLDVGLPRMDGYEVARRLRQVPELQRTRLVALTGFGQDADRRRASESGFDVHIVKPADWNRIRDVLHPFGENAASAQR